jgi:hypothetical protein
MIAGGFVVLGLFLLSGRWLSSETPLAGMATAARWFIPAWLIGGAVDMWIGVANAGYSATKE